MYTKSINEKKINVTLPLLIEGLGSSNDALSKPYENIIPFALSHLQP